jgi:hypothetical protein
MMLRIPSTTSRTIWARFRRMASVFVCFIAHHERVAVHWSLLLDAATMKCEKESKGVGLKQAFEFVNHTA